ncbi:MAG TPA: hypothetical protein VG893_00060 [Terracidiphilus sp.]|nr:hypothetical protein [Terracidiphilus sp.]
MPEPLHPLTLGEILDRTAQMYRARFLVYLGIGVVPAGTLLVLAGASFLLMGWMGITTANPASAGAQTAIAFALLGGLGLVSLPLYIGSTSLGWAALCDAGSRAFLGEAITIRGSFKNVWRRGWSYVGLLLLMGLIIAVAPGVVIFAVTMVTAAVAALARQSAAGGAAAFLTGLLIFALILGVFVYAVWMLLKLALALPACVVEGIGPWQAIKRANSLSKGTRGRIILLFLLGWAANTLLLIAFMVPVVIVIALIPGSGNAAHAERLGQIFVLVWYGLSFGVQAFTYPIYGIGLTLFYFDQRIRKEGFDIEWMMRGAGMVPPPAPPPEVEAVPWLPPVPARSAQGAEAPAPESRPEPEIPPPAGDPA